MRDVPRDYELTFILPPSLAEDEINQIQDNVQSWITNQSGEIVKASHWGRKRLAYAIENYKEGYYIFLQVKTPPSSWKDVDRRMRLDSNILRHLVVRMDD